jgi:hypothetical protein
MQLRITISTICFLFLYSVSNAQVSGVPASVKWKQIKTDTARIIFSNGAERQAQEIADIIHTEAGLNPFRSGKLRRINIVLHNRTTLSNGYVGLAPFRSEYYLIPGSDVFDFGNLPWQTNLAIHEYRHVQQFNSFRHGLGKIFGVLFGESGLAVSANLTAPDWFFEGDAVYAETQLTNYGRGRRPSFFNEFKSLWQEGINYSWMKLRNGSFKDIVPNHYPLGYLLVNYGYEKYGKDFWPNVIKEAGSLRPGFINAIEHHSHTSFKKFRIGALNFYKNDVKDTVKQNTSVKTVTNYHYPQFTENGSVIALKTSYKTLPAFVITNSGNEKLISKKELSTESWFHYNNNKIVYTAYSTDPRWDLRNYNDIVVLDIDSKEKKWLTHKEKYFTPSFSAANDKIIAVAFTDSLTNEIRLLDANTGAVEKIIAKTNEYFIQPRFVSDNKIVTAIRNDDGKISLQTIDLANNNRKVLIEPTMHTLGYPFVQHDTIFFTASFKGNDDLYAITPSNKIFQLTEAQTGNYNASVGNANIAWSAFTAHGYDLKQQQIASLLWKPVNEQILQTEFNYKVAQPLTAAFQTQDRNFGVKKYKKTTGFFNYHSWFPQIGDPEYGFILRGDNILNTFSNELSYTYNSNENSNTVGLNAIYSGWFPVIEAGANYTFNRHLITPAETITLNQSDGHIGVSVPLNFTKGKLYKLLSAGTSFHFTSVNPTGASKGKYKSSNESYVENIIAWQHFRPQAYQQLLPKFGYTFNIQDKRLLSKQGYQFNGSSQLFVPGILKTHGIQLTAGFQQTDTGNIVFSNDFANARGYENHYFSKMWKLGVNYHMPLFYPDWGFANALYFKRVRTNLFYDHSTVYSKDRKSSRNFRSAGSEIMMDIRLLNVIDAAFGVRYSHLLDNDIPATNNRNKWEFIIPFSF